jgi:hypothetical protein
LCTLWLASMPTWQKAPKPPESPSPKEVQASQPTEGQEAPRLSEV